MTNPILTITMTQLLQLNTKRSDLDGDYPGGEKEMNSTN
jgi:hypothetical protein